VTTRQVEDTAVDDAAVGSFIEEYGEAATTLPSLAIVIAAFNEEGAIGPVVSALPSKVAGLDAITIVVSDGAVDGTAKEAASAGAMVCEVPVNRGQGAALRLGYRLAREGGASYIVTTDADGQYNPAEIERLLTPILAGEADFVTGSRRLGSEESRDPVRRLGVRVFALAISALTGQRISDTTFGLRAMRSEVTGAVRLEQPQYQAAELLIGVITHGYRVVERPATIHKRTVGSSKKGNNVFYGLSFARVVVGTWWRERQRRGRGSAGSPGRAESAASTSPTGARPSAASPVSAAPGVIANGATPPDGGASASGSEAVLDPRSTKRT
jgi:glycosyltransferase involved in cell wall biosynthesis